MKKLILLFALLLSFAGAAFGTFCDTIHGTIEIVDIPHGEAKIKITQFEPSFQEYFATVNHSNGYWEFTPPNEGTWYVRPNWYMDSGYEEQTTVGTWFIRFNPGPGNQSIQQQVAFVYNPGSCNHQTQQYWTWHIWETFTADTATCEGKRIIGRVKNQYGNPDSGRYVDTAFWNSTGPEYQGNWYTPPGLALTNAYGYYTYELLGFGPTASKCGRWKVEPASTETGTWSPTVIVVDIWESSDTDTYVEDFVRTP